MEIKELKKMLRYANYTVYTQVNHVSKSGMSRSISLYIPAYDKSSKRKYICKLDYHVKDILGHSIDKNSGGLRVYGCGMDMGFDLVYRLSHRVYNNRKKYNGDLAYKLRQEWL